MKIGVVGSGVMGKGVAQRFAQGGHDVVLYDTSIEVIENAAKEIQRNLQLANMFQKKFDVEEVLSHIKLASSYENFKEVDYVVENVPEVQEIKESVYKQLETVCKESCIYMVNTSCVPITKVGSFTNRADKVIGVHFMNPVPMKNFAEVIKGFYTSESTIEEIRTLLADVGIEIDVVNDSAGFVSNRLSHLLMNEAAFLVYEGIATPEQIDNILKKAFGHKMGPLETADLIGLDTVLDSLKVLYDEYEDSKFRACPLLKQKVSAGLTGRKTGKGFYNY